jgi:hypothetical protein
MPVLDPPTGDTGDVARRPHSRVARAPAVVDQHTVAGGEPCLDREGLPRPHADARHHQRGGKLLVADPRRVTRQPRDSRGQPQLDPMPRQPISHPGAEPGAEDASPQPWRHLHHRRPQSQRGQAACHLQADEAAADDHHRRAGPGSQRGGAEAPRIG